MADNDDIAAYLAEHNERQVLLLRSSTRETPNTGGMEPGELAVYYARGSETLYVKNSAGEAVPFSSDTLLSTMVSSWISSWVSYEQIQASGAEIGTITIGGKPTTIYAPGAQSISFTPSADYDGENGVAIGSITIDGDEYVIYAPDPGDGGGRYHAPTYASGLVVGTGVGVGDLYVPVATSSRLGVARLGSDVVQTTAANGVTAASGRTYAVQLDGSSRMVVNVPWTDALGDSPGSNVATATSLGLVRLGTDATMGTSGRYYPVGLTGSGQMYVNVPWTDSSSGLSYPVATTSVLGLVRLGSDTVQGAAANTVTSESGRTYAVQLDGSSRMVVNVPWTDTLGDSPESRVATSTSLGVVRLGSDTRQTTSANGVTAASGRTYAVQLNGSSQMVVNVPWEKGMTVEEADARFLRLTGGTETGRVTFEGGIYIEGIAGSGGGITFESSNSGELTIDYNGIRTETGLNIDFTTGGTTMYLNDDSGDTHVTIDGNDGTIAIDGGMAAESVTLTGGDGTRLLGDDGSPVTVGSGLSLGGGTLTGYYHTPTYASGLDIGAGTNVSDLYVPVATSSRLGVAMLGSDTVQNTAANGVTSTSGRTYAVQLDGSSRMVVNVPWVDTDTTYSTATTSTLGLVRLGTGSTMATSGKYYPVGLTGSGQMYVNVPWVDTDTTYSTATTSSLGLVKLGTGSTMATSGKYYPVGLTGSGQMYVNVPWTDTAGDAGGVGSTVSYTQDLASGTRIGTITIDGESTSIYAPSQGSSGSTVTYASAQTSGDVIGTLTIDGTSYKLYCANDGGGGGGTTYSVATSTELGLVKLGSDTRQTTAANGVSSTSGRTYAVQLNASSQMVVNVPWTDTVSGGGGGSTVSYSPDVTGGTRIGTITIDGAGTSIFVPTPSFSSTYTSSTGVQIGSFSFNGSTTILYAPSAGGAVSDGNYYHTPLYTSGLGIGTGVGISNLYVPVATSSQLGVAKLGVNTVQETAANVATATSGRTYAVQLNSASQMVVNVPWTEYSTATYSALGLVKLGSNTVQETAANGVTATSGRTYAVQLDGSSRMVVNVPWTSSGGSTVSFTQTQTSGTRLGTITIDGTSTGIYSPSVSYSPTLTSGTEVGKLTINGTTTTLYCSSGGGGTDVNVTNTLSTSSASVYITGTSSQSTNTGTQLFSGGVYFIPSSGYVYASAYYETSDARLKEGISDVPVEDMARDINIRQFSFRADESKTRRYGVIAQELEEAGLGNLVSTDGEGIKSVDYISMLCLKVRQLEDEIRNGKEMMARVLDLLEDARKG